MNVGENYVQVDQADIAQITAIDVPDLGSEEGFVFKVTAAVGEASFVCCYALDLEMLQQFVEDAVAFLAAEESLDLPRVLMAEREGARAAL